MFGRIPFLRFARGPRTVTVEAPVALAANRRIRLPSQAPQIGMTVMVSSEEGDWEYVPFEMGVPRYRLPDDAEEIASLPQNFFDAGYGLLWTKYTDIDNADILMCNTQSIRAGGFIPAAISTPNGLGGVHLMYVEVFLSRAEAENGLQVVLSAATESAPTTLWTANVSDFTPNQTWQRFEFELEQRIDRGTDPCISIGLQNADSAYAIVYYRFFLKPPQNPTD